MSPVFESFEYLNRSSETRMLENVSLRSTFLWLLLGLFVLGMLAGVELFSLVRLNRFDWTMALVSLAAMLNVFRQARIIYRSLAR